MKTKKRHQNISSEESEESDLNLKSSSSSGSGSESSVSEHRYKKKRKRAESSGSESESDDQKRSKKRKHKKKKKKHGKKKRRSDSVESVSEGEDVSASEGDVSSRKKRKHKHKHNKRARSLSVSVVDEERVQRRLHSVVKERRASSEEGNHPTRTYYQKEYRRSQSAEPYDREREVQRFYRGSSKERRHQEQYQYDRERNDRYASYQQEKYDKNREKFGQNSQYIEPNDDFGRRQREYTEYKRNPRYEDHRPPEEEYQRRPKEENYHSKPDPRGFNNRYNQYEGPKRREYPEGRDYRERRVYPETERFPDREQKEKYREVPTASERPRDPRRDKITGRLDKATVATVTQHRVNSKSRSPEDRYRDRNRRPEQREDREDRYRDVRGQERRERPVKTEDRKPDRGRERPGFKERERKSRFADAADNKEYNWGKSDVKNEGEKSQGDKEKPNFALSGKLTADANTVNGVVIKYTEPDDAKQPKRRWRFYPFKGDKALPILYIHRQSAFLIGRDKKVVDIALEHPSVSKQHAALQFRATPFDRADGSQGKRVRPYVIDLDSANGTFVNNKKIDPRRYVELLERDVVKFGFSQREYVLLHENSKDDAQDDDNQEPAATTDIVTTTDQIKQEKRIKQEMVEDGD